ncbi:MAG: hypothetical protein IPO26_21440 [Saprospiraceae bacterium]|nr:hypothetical protein [Saprospiraceae bacterium]
MDKRNINVKMVPKSSDLEITVRAGKIEDVGMVREEVTELKILPTASGNFGKCTAAYCSKVSMLVLVVNLHHNTMSVVAIMTKT